MKKLILAAATLALMSGAAMANEVNGVVAKFNPQVRVVTLTNGDSYTIPRDVAVPQLKPGEKVSIMAQDDGYDVSAVVAGSMM